MKKISHSVGLGPVILFLSACSPGWTNGEVPFVPTPLAVVDRMLEMAEIESGDVLYDLGSGDGRIVIQAAKKYGIRAVGIEIDPKLVSLSRTRAKQEGVEHLVNFREEDALTADVSPATVVTLYMLPEFNDKLKPKLRKQLQRGSRVVSHDFDIDGWSAKKVEKIGSGRLHRHIIYLWRIEEQPR